MSDNISKTIEEAMAKKIQKLEEEKEQRIADKNAYDNAFKKAAKWLEDDVYSVMQEFVSELEKKGISAEANFRPGNLDAKPTEEPSAYFRILVTERQYLGGAPLAVSFVFRSTEEILISYGDSSGKGFASRDTNTCRVGWKRDALKRQIDPVVEAYFTHVWTDE